MKRERILRRFAGRELELHWRTFVDVERRTFYVETPKAACTVMKTVLASFAGGLRSERSFEAAETSPEMLIHDRGRHPTPSLLDVTPEVAEAALTSDEWFRLCVVRNPYERAFSGWFSKILLAEPFFRRRLRPGAPMPPDRIGDVQAIYDAFAAFVAYLEDVEAPRFSDPHWGRQWDHLLEGEVSWTSIARQEDLGGTLEPWREHLARLGFSLPALPRMNVSGLALDAARVSPETFDRLQRLYRVDFERYGYDAEDRPAASEAMSPDVERMFLLYVRSTIGRNQRLESVFDALWAAEKERTMWRDRYELVANVAPIKVGRWLRRRLWLPLKSASRVPKTSGDAD